MRDKTKTPSVLILSSRFDFTCDYVVAALRRRGIEYLRLNSEDLAACSVTLNPVSRYLYVCLDKVDFLIAPDSLRSILFRRPVYLRDYGDDQRPAQERFASIQWAAFLCNFTIFDEVRWYNEPAHTYRAEHKAYQLYMASRIGFNIPATIVTNSPGYGVMPFNGTSVAIKGLDTVLIREDGDEIFGFTTFGDFNEFIPFDWAPVPGIIQEKVADKTDIRVTVIENQTFAAKILIDGGGISDDWRTHKKDAQFISHELTPQVRQQCIALVNALGLRFGAIDLALVGETYYFFEINPTGEWAWLVDAAKLPIDEVIADALAR